MSTEIDWERFPTVLCERDVRILRTDLANIHRNGGSGCRRALWIAEALRRNGFAETA